MQSETLSIVVPTHNRARRIEPLVSSVGRDDRVEEIIVVDDASTDSTPAVVASLEGGSPRVRGVRLRQNVGPTQARRIGVAAASSEVVLCIDDDVLLGPGAVAGHLARRREGFDVVIGYMPVDAAAHATGAVMRRYSDVYEHCVGRWRGSPDQVLASLWGGFVSFTRIDYLEAGERCMSGLRYHEDLELGLMLQEMGRRACFDPAILAHHHHVRSVAGTLLDNRRGGEAIAQLERRHPSLVHAAGDFTRERSNPIWAAMMRVAGQRSLWPLCSAAIRMCEPRNPDLADRLLEIGCRANYYVGYAGNG